MWRLAVVVTREISKRRLATLCDEFLSAFVACHVSITYAADIRAVPLTPTTYMLDLDVFCHLPYLRHERCIYDDHLYLIYQYLFL